MLFASGPNGTKNLKDYTNQIDMDSVEITLYQGNTISTMKARLYDLASTATILPENDIVALDQNDPNGWPTLNLALNGSMEGVYVGNVARNWTAISTATGITYAKSATAKFGSGSQSVTIANTATSNNCGIYQDILLPTDENAAVIFVPYFFSAWVSPQTTLAGISGSGIKIDWYTKLPANGGSFISNNFTGIDTQLQHAGASWQQVFATGTPPSNATACRVSVYANTNSGTNSGNFLIDGAQLEAATFQRVLGSAYPMPFQNPNMISTSGGTICDGYYQATGGSGGTYSVITSPSLHGQSQQIVVAAGPANSFWNITQATIPINPYETYTVSMQYQITAQPTNGAYIRIGGNLHDKGNSFLSALTVPHITSAPTNVWLTTSYRVGPGTNNPMTTNVGFLELYAGVANGATSGSTATVIIGQITVVPDPLSLQSPNATQTALAAGIYPTAFCDAAQPGCNVDRGYSGLPYRQLRIFAGYIRKASYDYTTSPERLIDLDCTGYDIMLQEAPATLILQAQTDKTAIAAAFVYAQNQGFLAGVDYTTYVDAITTIDSVAFSWQTTNDVMTSIANIAVATYWIDNYKFLHYKPSLATNAPYAMSDAPDMVTSFPMAGWKFDNDSTQSFSTKVFEGSTTLSLPVTDTFNGDGSQVAFTLNNGIAIAQVDSCTVGGFGRTVGLAGVQQFSDGYDALVDPNTGIITFAVAPGSGTNNVVVIFRYPTPVLVRIRSTTVEVGTGALKRRIHYYQTDNTVTSINQALARANADLNQYSKPRPIGNFGVYSPPAPNATPLQPNMAISITHAASKLSNQLFQIQKMTVRPKGPNLIYYECDVGFYRPDFAIQMSQINRIASTLDQASTVGTTLNDVLGLQDGWAVTDALTKTVGNVGKWGPSTSSNWDGSFVWG